MQHNINIKERIMEVTELIKYINSLEYSKEEKKFVKKIRINYKGFKTFLQNLEHNEKFSHEELEYIEEIDNAVKLTYENFKILEI